MSDKWYIQFLDGSPTEVVGDITLDTEGGVVEFRDDGGKLVAFQNLGAVAFGEIVMEEDDES
mgnify:CR=1 FL=1